MAEAALALTAGVLRVAIDRPLRSAFDYLPPPGIDAAAVAPGVRVRVPVGRGRTIGVVVGHAATSDVPAARLKAVDAVLDERPLFDAAALELLKWTAEYYHHPLGEVVAAALPRALRDGAPLEPRSEFLVCNADGAAALAAGEPRRAPRQHALLERIAGHAGGVPAEALTRGVAGLAQCGARARCPRLGGARGARARGPRRPVARCRSRTRRSHADAGAVRRRRGNHDCRRRLRHLRAAGRDRQRQDRGVPARGGATRSSAGAARWCWCRRSASRRSWWRASARASRGRSRCCIQALTRRRAPGRLARCACSGRAAHRHRHALGGVRAAARIWGSSSSTRSTTAPTSSRKAAAATRRATWRCCARSTPRVPVVLGSATPALETLHNVQQRTLSAPAAAAARRPGRRAEAGADRPARAVRARDGMSAAGAAGHRAPSGGGRPGAGLHQPPRLRADAAVHLLRLDRALPRLRRAPHRAPAAPRRLRCHYCGADEPLPERCPRCGFAVKPVGQGTERIEETLAELFPTQRLVRLDRDTARRARRHRAGDAGGARRRSAHPGRHADGHQGPSLSRTSRWWWC